MINGLPIIRALPRPCRSTPEFLGIILSISFLFLLPSSGEDTSLASVARSYFDKALAAAKGLVKGEETKAETTPPVDPDEIARETTLGEAKAAIFLAEGGYHFTQSRWGAVPAPYQIEGLELVPLAEGTLNQSDVAVGVDRRVTYEFRAANHRRFHEQTGWGRWIKGLPPHLDSITLVREKGIWKTSVSPLWAYSLK